MSRRWRSRTIDVSVDVSDIIDDIDTETLVEELQRRNKCTSFAGLGSEWVDRLRFYLERGDIHGARAMLDSEEVRAMVSDEARAAQYASMQQSPH